jgi:hypothetical protein
MNPLALGHFANHPPPGVLPNVVAAAFDVPHCPPPGGHAQNLRWCVPNVLCGGEGMLLNVPGMLP